MSHLPPRSRRRTGWPNDGLRTGASRRALPHHRQGGRTFADLEGAWYFSAQLEVFETMGMVEPVLEGRAAAFWRGLPSGRQGNGAGRFFFNREPVPFVISLPQSETERILIEHLARLGVTVEREVELTGLIQTDTSVRATVRHADGRAETIETPWMVGCDGAHSTTRHALGLEFEGAPYDESFVLADVRAESSLSTRRAASLLFPRRHPRHFPFRGRPRAADRRCAARDARRRIWPNRRSKKFNNTPSAAARAICA